MIVETYWKVKEKLRSKAQRIFFLVFSFPIFHVHLVWHKLLYEFFITFSMRNMMNFLLLFQRETYSSVRHEVAHLWFKGVYKAACLKAILWTWPSVKTVCTVLPKQSWTVAICDLVYYLWLSTGYKHWNYFQKEWTSQMLFSILATIVFVFSGVRKFVS